MTTRGSCGNSLRNVTCCPLQPRHLLERVARQVASQLAQLWLPSAAWLDIETWVPVEHGLVENSQNVGDWTASELEHDRAYPDGYLPHKWKIGVATEDHNCINVRANDLGIVLRQMPVVSQASQIGVANSSPIVADLWIGGGLSYRLGEEGGTPVSLPILAEPLGTARLEDIEPIVRTLMNMHRQFVVDQQADAVIRRRYKRLKYFVRHLGAQAIASRLLETTGLKLEPIENVQQNLGQRVLAQHEEINREQFKSPAQGCVSEWCEHAVFEPSEDGRWQVTVGVRGGRLRFDEGAWNAWEQLLTRCRSVCVGPRHTLVFGGVESQDREAINALIQDWFEEQLFFSAQQLGVVTCVALPTCPLAVADAERSERAWRRAVAEAHPWLEELLVALGRVPSSLDSDAGQSTEAGNRKIRVAVSGCTNGCSLPLLADVGFVAESAGLFRLYVGGGANGLGVPLETLSGPEQLVKTSQRLCQELREVVRRGGSGQKWFTQKSESWNFTWPQRQN
jgi:sulfite reductase beta subunit-like hemoprotein